MIQTLLDTLDRPWQTRQAGRKPEPVFKRIRKNVKIAVRRTRRTVSTFDRRQYYLADAISDLRSAASRNEDIVILSVATVLAVVYAVLDTAATYMYAVLQAAYELATLTGMNMLLLMVLVAGILATLCGWIAAFLLNVCSVAVMDGSNRKRHRTIRSTFRTALGRSGRVTAAWFLLLLAICLPLLLSAATTAIIMRNANTSVAAATGYLPYATAFVIAWLLFVLTRYALAPKIALQEPSLGMFGAFSRSRQLLRRKGRLTVVMLCIMATGLGLATYQLAVAANEAIEGLGSLVVFLGATGGALLLNGMLAMLYCKSKRVRKA